MRIKWYFYYQWCQALAFGLGADHSIPGGRVSFFFLTKLFFSSQQENITFFFLPKQKQTISFLRCHRQIFFFQDMFKDPFNCETGMRGTVKCRPTVWPIEYRLTAWISATKLITWYYSNETLTQCCFNVRPTSATTVLSIHIHRVSCFAIPAVKKSVSLQTQRPAKSQG